VSWDYNDPDIERVVEIYQACAAPTSTTARPIRRAGSLRKGQQKLHLECAGAQAENGIHRQLGSSLDAHVVRAVYSRGIDRDSIFERPARQAHLAATDKILLDFFYRETPHGRRDRSRRNAGAGGPVEGPVHRADRCDQEQQDRLHDQARTRSARFTFRDEPTTAKTRITTARVQADKNMAWASPIWVKSR